VPALRALRAAFPQHHLALACPAWLEQMVRLIGAVDELLPADDLVPLRLPPGLWPPDVAVNLHGKGPQSCVVLDELRPRRRIGHGGYGWDGPPWVEEQPERERWCAMLRAHGIPADAADLLLTPPALPSPEPGCVVVHPGAAFGSRRWPAERFAAVAREVARELAAETGEGLPVVITGTEGERGTATAVAKAAGLPPTSVLAGRTDLATLAAVVANARLVISGDTGVAHLGYAFRTPSVVLFGPLPASRWGPPAGGPHLTLSADRLRRGERFGDEPDPALLGVTVGDVVRAARHLLAAP
jgi:ADP-heptose:LPS heptosyltransferase